MHLMTPLWVVTPVSQNNKTGQPSLGPERLRTPARERSSILPLCMTYPRDDHEIDGSSPFFFFFFFKIIKLLKLFSLDYSKIVFVLCV